MEGKNLAQGRKFAQSKDLAQGRKFAQSKDFEQGRKFVRSKDFAQCRKFVRSKDFLEKFSQKFVISFKNTYFYGLLKKYLKVVWKTDKTERLADKYGIGFFYEK